MGFLDLLGKPLGIAMSFIYQWIPNYFITLFIFTFLIRLLLFPISLKQQKSSMDRARLAPAMERLQKKYANDRQKLAEKQQQLYEKHGVSMTAGCLPMLLSMVVLFGVIAAIYSPLTNLSKPPIPEHVIAVSQQAIIAEGTIPEDQFKGYYGELRLMKNADEYKEQILAELTAPSEASVARAGVSADVIKGEVNKIGGPEAVYNQIVEMSDQFTILNTEYSLLDQPWNGGFQGINFLWIIPIVSGITSFFVSWISTKNNKKIMGDQPGAGCTNNMMLIYMPAMSLFIAFTVPGAVGIYWIFSNLLSMLQTVILYKIYDPAKARAEAEAEYQERRRKKAEDKKRLAQARQKEEAEARKAEQELERRREESREMSKKKNKNKKNHIPNGNHVSEKGGSTDAVEDTQTAAPADDTGDASEE